MAERISDSPQRLLSTSPRHRPKSAPTGRHAGCPGAESGVALQVAFADAARRPEPLPPLRTCCELPIDKAPVADGKGDPYQRLRGRIDAPLSREEDRQDMPSDSQPTRPSAMIGC